MTDTANAPERDNMPDTIMAWPDFDGCITGAWSANQYSDERAREYISRTHCDELVAAAYLDAARVPTGFLVGDPPNGIPLRNPMAHEVAEAIKARTPDNARAALTARDERMKAEGAREAQAKIARLTEALDEKQDGGKDFWMNWAKKRLEINRAMFLRDAKMALAGDMRALRNRVELMEAEPVQLVLSAALQENANG